MSWTPLVIGGEVRGAEGQGQGQGQKQRQGQGQGHESVVEGRAWVCNVAHI